MSYTYGSSAGTCSTANTPSGARNAVVSLQCSAGSPSGIAWTAESPTCKYHFALAIDCSGNPDAPGTLCVSPSLVSATPRPTPATNAVCVAGAPDGDVRLVCPNAGQVITSIPWASFGTPVGSTCTNFAYGTCSAPGSAAFVYNMCAGLSECVIPGGAASLPIFGGDPCYGVVKSLSVSAVCGSPSSIGAAVIPSTSGRCVANVGENTPTTLNCPTTGQVITSIDYATYGTGTGSCATGFTDGSCASPNAYGQISSICLGQASCVVNTNPSNTFFGADPCNGIAKHVSVMYSCGPQVTSDMCATAAENAVATVSTCPTGQIITAVRFASYGTPVLTYGCGGYEIGRTTTAQTPPGQATIPAGTICSAANSMSFVQQACLGLTTCSVTASNTNFLGDPCYGTVKTLAIDVVCGYPTGTPTPTASPSVTASPSSTFIPSTTPSASATVGTDPSTSTTPIPPVSSTASPTAAATPVVQPAWLAYLSGNTYEVYYNEAVVAGYDVVPFASVTQVTPSSPTVAAGKYGGWNAWVANAGCASGLALSSQTYPGGAYGAACSTSLTGQQRVTTLSFACSVSGATYMTQASVESPACAFALTINVNCSGNPYGGLCVAPSATATPTMSQSVGAVPSTSPTTPPVAAVPSSTATTTAAATTTPAMWVWPQWMLPIAGTTISTTRAMAGAFGGYQQWNVRPFVNVDQVGIVIGTWSALGAAVPAPAQLPGVCASSTCTGCAGNCDTDSTCKNGCDSGYTLRGAIAAGAIYANCNGYGVCVNNANPVAATNAAAYNDCWAVNAAGYCIACPKGTCGAVLQPVVRSAPVAGGWMPLASDPTCPSGQAYTAQQMQGGAVCSTPGGSSSTTQLNYACGAPGSVPNVTYISESAPCSFAVGLTIDCSSNPAVANTLCTIPSATSTPSYTSTPTMSSSLSSTGSTSLTMSATATVSPSWSASSTSSTSMSASLTASTGATPTSSPSTTPTQTPTMSQSLTGSNTPTSSPSFFINPSWMNGPIAGRTFSAAAGSSTFSVHPFASVSATTAGVVSSAGTYYGWTIVADATCISGLRFVSQFYANGDVGASCGTPGGVAQSNITYVCASSNSLQGIVTESPACSYSFTMNVNCVLNTQQPGTLCLNPTPSSTPSNTPSASTTPSTSATTTASPSSSLTQGATPPETPSGTAAATITPLPTVTPLSPNFYKARVAISFSHTLLFSELIVFSPSGQLLSASAAGAAPSLSSGTGAAYGGDLCANPYDTTTCPQAASGPASSGYYEVAFPAAPGYAQGYPTSVGTAYYVNNVAGGSTQQDIVNGLGHIEFYSANGTVLSRSISTSATVTTVAVSPWAVPASPDPSDPWQVSDAALSAARYVRVVGAGVAPLAFREIFVFDTNFVNVALRKSATSSGQVTGDITAYTPAMGCNGVIDMDNSASGDMTNSNTAVGAWWQVDLGAAYNVTTIMIWNRYLPSAGLTGAGLAGAVVQLLNINGALVGSATLTSAAVQTVVISTYAPTGTASSTAASTVSGTSTRSSSATPSTSQTHTASPTGSTTLSSTQTASTSFGASKTQTPSTTQTPASTPSITPSFTPYPWYMAQYMYGTNYLIPSTGGFTFHSAPWGVLAQYSNAGAFFATIGSFINWDIVADATCPTGARLVAMRYGGGSTCAGGPGGANAAYVNVSCGDNGAGFTQASTAYGSTVSLVATCTYRFSLVVDCSLNTAGGM